MLSLAQSTKADTDDKLISDVSRRLVSVPVAILDSLGDMAFRLSKDGVILEYHAPEPGHLFIPPAVFLGRSIRDTMPPDVAEPAMQYLAKALETGRVQLHEYELAYGENDLRAYEARLAPDGSGGVVVVVRDITDRKFAEEALRRSEAMYRSLFENMLNGFAHCRMIWDGERPVDFEYLAVNSAFEETTGLRGVVGKRVTEVIPGIREADPELFEIYGRVARTGRPESFEIFVSALDMWFAVSVYRPAPGQFVAIFDVITERKRTEAALRESESRLRDVTFSMADWVWELDAKGAYTYSSPKVFDYFGLSPEEVIGQTPFDFMPPDEAERASRIFAQAAANKAPIRDVESWNILKDGRRVCFLTNGLPVLDENGNLTGYRGVDKDITERKRAEVLMTARIDLSERLADADADTLLQQTLDHAELLTGSNIGFFHFVDPDQQNLTLQTWSTNTLANMCTAKGKGQHYPIARAGVWAECFHRREPVIHNDYESLPNKRGMPEGHARVKRELVVPVIQNNLVTALLGVGNKPFDYTDDDVRAVQSLASMAMEVVARKMAEREKERLAEQLAQAMKMEVVGRLAGGVAHDFNNLLTVIGGNIDLLLSDISDNDPLREDLSEIRSAADRAAALTAQLLAFSRKQVIDPRVVDLNDLVGSMTKMLKRLIGEDVELSFAPGVGGRVKVDPHQMEQVLINLSVNARDAMPEGGRLQIQTGFADIDGEYVRTHLDASPGPHVVLSVEDTGVGIEPSVLKHLFEPFFTTKEKGKGTGLGLSMVYGIVRQSGGFLEVESTVGVGTVFRVFLPLADGEAAPVTAWRSPRHPRGTETILLVEDEDTVRAMARKFLERLGYRVIGFGGSVEAAAWARTGEPFDLLVTDVIMPKMNGRQLYEELSTHRPGLRVLYMSGYTGDVIANHGVLDEEINFVSKPFTLERLARAVRDVLNAKSAA